MKGSIFSVFNNMDLDQLYEAQSRVGRLINKKNLEPRVKIWMVCNSMMCLGNFPESEYLKAVELLADEAKKAEHDEEREMELLLISVPESEASEYLKL